MGIVSARVDKQLARILDTSGWAKRAAIARTVIELRPCKGQARNGRYLLSSGTGQGMRFTMQLRGERAFTIDTRMS